ncbi:Beta-galactosidase, partial [Bienertia sinuspersici]
TTFKTPIGKDPVMVDLTGMGKGIDWVNGESLRRYWPSFVSNEDGCQLTPCDYRGPYDNKKCVTGCQKPIQKEYHIPRSFLKTDRNTLVLFEEFGGNPSNIKFKTIATAAVCATVNEGNTLEVTCDGRPISGIKFASFGDPQGICGNFSKGSCEGANNAQEILTK